MTNIPNIIYHNTLQRAGLFRHTPTDLPLEKIDREEKFCELISDYNESDIIQQMNMYIQHGDTTTLEHCKYVAWVSFVINEKLHLNSDEKELIAAAMLHDFYLYDWHDGDPRRKTHGFDHPYIANKNAMTYFQISPKVSAAILSHMWPLNLTHVPNSREAFLLWIADKYCTVNETMRWKKKQV